MVPSSELVVASWSFAELGTAHPQLVYRMSQTKIEWQNQETWDMKHFSIYWERLPLLFARKQLDQQYYIYIPSDTQVLQTPANMSPHQGSYI